MRIFGRIRRQVIFAILFFTVLTIIFTFPLTLKTSSYIPAFYSTDEPFAALWHFWVIKYSYINKLNISTINMIAVPFNERIGSGNIYWHLLNKALILLTNNVFAYTFQIFISFVLIGVITYFLTFRLVNNNLAAFFSGLIFAFCPYHMVRSWQHLGLSHIQWLPLYILTLLLLSEKKTFRNAALLAVSFSLVMSFDIYYAYFMFLVTVIFVIFFSLTKKDFKQTINLVKFLGISGILILILESPDLYNVFKFIYNTNKAGFSRGSFGYIRPLTDLFAQSAKPLSYFLPAAVHPIFGKFTEQFIGSPFYGVSLTEHTLYLGWVPLILSFIAVRRYRKNKKLRTANSELRTSEDFYIGFFIFLAITAWLFSQPPWQRIGQIKIYMPSFFMYKILPMFRAYCRFGIILMLAVSVLSGFGLKFILERFKKTKSKIAITTLFCSLVLFEFWNYPPFKVIDVSQVPQVYYWLKEEPRDFVIAEYPLDDNGPNEMYKFYQTKHEKKIINGTKPGTYANKVAKTISKLSNPNTAGILKWMEVKYALVHRQDYLRSELVEQNEELNKIPQNPGLKLIKNFPSQGCPQKDIMCVQKTGPIDVYEVMASPINPEVKE